MTSFHDFLTCVTNFVLSEQKTRVQLAPVPSGD